MAKCLSIGNQAVFAFEEFTFFMNTEESYNKWADQYDTNVNKTRDLEALSLKECLANIWFEDCLEIGCGTGKNTIWLLTKAQHITAVDLSIEMLSKAKEKVRSGNVNFIQADINGSWTFTKNHFDLITFSLVLEHIADLDSVFRNASDKIQPGGYVYVGELHPFKQYSGSKARFATESGEQIVPCFTQNLSDFTQAARENGFSILDIREYFDDGNRTLLPRILTMLFQKT
jgi:ubiquinone/menaquinone biosynthesis C-methylase UbiE